jgi:hypothetical protein
MATVTREKDELVIRVPLQPPAPSSTGKTLTVASTQGYMPTGVLLDGRVVKVSVNAYVQAPKEGR